jgi:hypothetical protein
VTLSSGVEAPLSRPLRPALQLRCSRNVVCVCAWGLCVGCLQTVRKTLGRPLTFSEKIIYGHLDDASTVRDCVVQPLPPPCMPGSVGLGV